MNVFPGSVRVRAAWELHMGKAGTEETQDEGAPMVPFRVQHHPMNMFPLPGSSSLPPPPPLPPFLLSFLHNVDRSS